VEIAVAVDCLIVYLLGVFPGHVGGTYWLAAGVKAVLIAFGTVLLIYTMG
jgi:hypothetical protein